MGMGEEARRKLEAKLAEVRGIKAAHPNLDADDFAAKMDRQSINGMEFWLQREIDEIDRKAKRCAAIGISDFRTLEYLEELERRLDALESKVQELASEHDGPTHPYELDLLDERRAARATPEEDL